MTASAKSKNAALVCSECGWRTTKWAGRCAECQAWGTLAEQAAASGPRTTPSGAGRALAVGEVDLAMVAQRTTGVSEFDRVLGGGLTPGAVVLFAGEPGVGKSTLLLDVAARAARAGSAPILYVSGEESAPQVRLRAERIDAVAEGLLLANTTDLGEVLGLIDRHEPSLVVVDSAQTIASAAIDGAAGSVTQVREVASALIQVAKARALPVVLVGHVTKDGGVAGPRTLEHLVDVVCHFEGDRDGQLRVLRSFKNRFGPTDEVGCFEMTAAGIESLADPSSLFISRATATAAAPGRCLTVTLEGKRPMTVEVQALLAPTAAAIPRRTTSGLDSARLAMVLAVLQRRAGLAVHVHDVYASTVGGARATEPAADLAAALACASSLLDRPLPLDTLAIGEVGLAGELRTVGGIERRLSEAARMGFGRAIVPAGTTTGLLPAGLSVVKAESVAEAVELAFGRSPEEVNRITIR